MLWHCRESFVLTNGCRKTEMSKMKVMGICFPVNLINLYKCSIINNQEVDVLLATQEPLLQLPWQLVFLLWFSRYSSAAAGIFAMVLQVQLPWQLVYLLWFSRYSSAAAGIFAMVLQVQLPWQLVYFLWFSRYSFAAAPLAAGIFDLVLQVQRLTSFF